MMLVFLLILLSTTLITCVPLSGNDGLNSENLDNGDTDLSSIFLGEQNTIDSNELSGAFAQDQNDDIAEVCESNLDNNGIFRRQTCKPSTGVGAPEKLHEWTTTKYPRNMRDHPVKSPPDPECVNFPYRPEFVTCGGPEIYNPYYDKS